MTQGLRRLRRTEKYAASLQPNYGLLRYFRDTNEKYPTNQLVMRAYAAGDMVLLDLVPVRQDGGGHLPARVAIRDGRLVAAKYTTSSTSDRDWPAVTVVDGNGNMTSYHGSPYSMFVHLWNGTYCDGSDVRTTEPKPLRDPFFDLLMGHPFFQGHDDPLNVQMLAYEEGKPGQALPLRRIRFGDHLGDCEIRDLFVSRASGTQRYTPQPYHGIRGVTVDQDARQTVATLEYAGQGIRLVVPSSLDQLSLAEWKHRSFSDIGWVDGFLPTDYRRDDYGDTNDIRGGR